MSLPQSEEEFPEDISLPQSEEEKDPSKPEASEEEEDQLDDLMGEMDKEVFLQTQEKKKEEILAKFKAQQEKEEKKLKAQKAEKKLVEAEDAMEENSKLLVKAQTRKIQQDEVEDLSRGRIFVSVQEMEKLIAASQEEKARGFFAIGVVTEIQRPFASGSVATKSFIKYSISDLQKYDLDKVKAQIKNSNLSEELKKEKYNSFNKSGYKVIDVMLFGQESLNTNFKIGEIVMFLNPRAMKSSEKTKKVAYSVEKASFCYKIGYSEEIQFCLGGASKLGFENCSAFVNKSVEKYCLRHKEQRIDMGLAKVRAGRPQLTKGDMNVLKTQLEFKQAEEFQFQNRVRKADGTIRDVSKKSVEALDPEQREKIQKFRQEQDAKLQKMFQKKAEKKANLLVNPLNKLTTLEKSNLSMNLLKDQVGKEERETGQKPGQQSKKEDEIEFECPGGSLSFMDRIKMSKKRKIEEIAKTEDEKKEEEVPQKKVGLKDLLAQRRKAGVKN